MIIVNNKLIPFGTYKAINICGIIFTKKPLSEIEKNHERIHSKQMIEMLIIGYYLWYVFEYLIIRFFHKKQVFAYRDISFEEEAYNNETNLNYVKERKRYCWIKYVKIKSNSL